MQELQHLCSCGEVFSYGPHQAGTPIACPACGAVCRPPELPPQAPEPPPESVPAARPSAGPGRRTSRRPSAPRRRTETRRIPPAVLYGVGGLLAALCLALLGWAMTERSTSRQQTKDAARLSDQVEDLDRRRTKLEAELEEATKHEADLAQQRDKYRLELERATATAQANRARRDEIDLELARERRTRAALELRLQQTEVALKLAEKKGGSASRTSSALTPGQVKGSHLLSLFRDAGYTCRLSPVNPDCVRVACDDFHIVVAPFGNQALLMSIIYGHKSGSRDQLLEKINEVNQNLPIQAFLQDDAVWLQGYFPIQGTTKPALLAHFAYTEAIGKLAVLRLREFLR